jgi:hypothetical protein
MKELDNFKAAVLILAKAEEVLREAHNRHQAALQALHAEILAESKSDGPRPT